MGKVTKRKAPTKRRKSLAVKDIEAKRLVGHPKILDITDSYMRHQLKTMGRLAMTMREAAQLFRVSVGAIGEWFERCPEARAIWEEGQADGNMSLRRAQYNMAMRNPVMNIWVGKNRLGQSDKAEQKITQDVNVNVLHSVHSLFDKIDAMAERGKALTNGAPGDDAKPVN
jgi:hypothetical protein